MIFPRGTGGVMLAILVVVTSDYRTILQALARFRRGTDAAFGSCLRCAFIIAIHGTIGSLPCSPTSIGHYLVSHSGNSRSAFGNLMMYCAASRSLISGFRLGKMIGSKKR
jgi:hypothetical protein